MVDKLQRTHAFTICFFNITVYVQYQQNNITIYFKDGKKSICTVTNDTKPGMVYRHYIYSDQAWLFISDSHY